MHVEVDEADVLPGRLRAGHRADAHRAVAAEHDGHVAGADRGLHPFRDLARRLRDAVGVLGAAVLAVGPPAAQRDVAEVAVGGEAGLTQRPGRLLLAGGEGAEARGSADDRWLA